MNRVVNINLEPCDYYIGRPSKWGNPYRVGIDGTRKECIDKYETWLNENKELMDDIMELDGKVLGCHCKPKPCHGDVIVKIINSKKLIDCIFTEDL